MRLEERFNHLERSLGALMTTFDGGMTDQDLIDLIKLQIRIQKEEVNKENINPELFLYFDKNCRKMKLDDLQDTNIEFENCNSGEFIDTLLERIIISFLFKHFSEKIKQLKNESDS